MQTGSLTNSLMANSRQPEPAVGVGVTILSWTDRHPGTVVSLQPDGSFLAREDRATRTDSNGMSECQEYEFEPNPHGRLHVFKRVKRGKAAGQWREEGKANGTGVLIGHRERYHDFSF